MNQEEERKRIEHPDIPDGMQMYIREIAKDGFCAALDVEICALPYRCLLFKQGPGNIFAAALSTHSRPNWWWRFWQWAFFGIEWRKR